MMTSEINMINEYFPDFTSLLFTYMHNTYLILKIELMTKVYLLEKNKVLKVNEY